METLPINTTLVEFLFSNLGLAVLIIVLIAITPALLGLKLVVRNEEKAINGDHGRSSSSASPGGSMGLPYLGETLDLLKPHESNSIGSFLQQHCKSYGKVFKSHVFGSPAIISCDLELNMFVLQNEEKLFQTSYPKVMHGILGRNSLLLVSGDVHKKLRQVGVNFINSSKSRIKFLRCLETLTLSLMDSWRDREEVSFVKEAKTFTLSLMVNNLLSIDPSDPSANQILRDFEKYMKGFISLPVYFPGTSYFNAVKARERLASTIKEIMRQRRKCKAMGPKEEGEGREGDFVDAVLAKETLNDEERVSVVLDILLGGYETTATLMSLIVYFLAHCSSALDKLKEEHQAIRETKKDGEALSWEDYKKMEFTYYVILESLRCGNVVKFVHRKALQDVNFKGILIPSGWKVLPMFTPTHLDPLLHDNPQLFNPWRWANDKELRRKVTPFGGGLRLCPGAELAKVVIAFFLHHLVLNYRWKTKADDVPLAHPYVEFRRGLLLEMEPCSEITTTPLMVN